MNIEILKQLSNLHSVASETEEMQGFLKKMLSQLGIPFRVSSFGVLIVGDISKAKITFNAHIDQVGFQITKINTDGTCQILPIGWVPVNRLDHNSIYIQTDSGKVYGAIFNTNSLKVENHTDFSQIFLSVGSTSYEETIAMGIKVGSTGSFKKDFWTNKNAIFSTGIDNIISIFALLSVLEKDKTFLEQTAIIFHTDEEVINHSANGIASLYPTPYAVIMDYLPTALSSIDVFPKIGEGPTIAFRGGSHILHSELKNKLENLNIFKSFISETTLPGLEPQNYQNNGVTKALNYLIPALGYHGGIYCIRNADLESFISNIPIIKNLLL